MDQFLRGLIEKEWKIGKHTVSFFNVLFLMGITVAGFMLRYSLKNIVTNDWVVYWEPWIDGFKENGGFKAIRGNFFYDYTPPFMYVLWVISILPMNPMTAYKGISCVFDVFMAIGSALIIWEITKHKTKAVFTYGMFLLVPTFVADSAFWAQCDQIYAAFVVFSVYFLLKDKPNFAMILYGTAFAFKLQTLFIFPFLMILWAKKRLKIQHFLWLVVMYFVWILPAWIAGRPFYDLLMTYFAQGTQDVWALALKWPNIYELLYPFTFLLEYAEAGMYLILAILMCVMYYLAKKKYTITNEFLILLILFFSVLTPYFLPHMHERYGYLGDVFAIILMMINIRRFYVPVVHILVSFAAYTAYLCQERPIPLAAYALVLLALLLDLGRMVYQHINHPANAYEEIDHG